MQPEPLRVTAATPADRPVLRLFGDLDRSGAGAIRNALVGLDPGNQIVLDMTGVAYMDSGGIGSLIQLLDTAGERGAELRVFGLDDHFHKIFEITHLTDLITVYPDEAAAIATAAPREES